MKPIGLLLLAPALLATGCATPAACRSGERAMVADTLFLGTASPDGPVPAQAWSAFLQDTATPRFPQGLSWWPARGQWREASGAVVHEASYVLQIVHAGGEAEQRAVQEIASVYKARFRQEAVLRTRSAACVSF